MSKCRICRNDHTQAFLKLGPTPLANSFLNLDQLNSPEPTYPLDVVFCPACGLVQLDHVVPPTVMFRNYLYVSSTSDTMRSHFAAYAGEVIDRFLTVPDQLVIEFGSNDGCLLREIQKRGARTLGIEPATNLALRATDAGIETLNDFFCLRTATVARERFGPAKVLSGNNVLAHIEDLHDVVKASKAILDPAGVAVFEVPYLAETIRNNEFDTIYHEHLYYFSLKPLMRLFQDGAMRVFDVKRVPVHGGSLRLYVTHAEAPYPLQDSVTRLLAEEESQGLHHSDAYKSFSQNVATLRERLRELLRSLKNKGARIAAYGAPAKGNTLLNHFGIGRETIDFVADRNPLKQGLYTPGTHIPVVPVDRILSEQPDFVLVLAWNFIDEIVLQQCEYLKRGGLFIVPIPTPRVVDESVLERTEAR